MNAKGRYVLLAASMLAGCSNADAPAIRADRVDPVVPVWSDTAVYVTRPAGAGVAEITTVRAAAGLGFERIVFEFAGTDLPGYRVAYIDGPARQCASGLEVETEGRGLLEIRLQPAQAHNSEGSPAALDLSALPSGSNLKRLVQTCDFEADAAWVANVLSRKGFRVLKLTSPARLVVDLQKD